MTDVSALLAQLQSAYIGFHRVYYASDVEALLVGLQQQENVLDSPTATGLLLSLKQECEKQHARAEAAEARLSALHALVVQWRTQAKMTITFGHESLRIAKCADELAGLLVLEQAAERTETT